MAVKGYQQAKRIRPENTTVVRELGGLQLYSRNILGWSQCTMEVLSSSIHRSNPTDWFSYACASHLLGNVDVCLKCIDVYVASQDMPAFMKKPLNRRIMDQLEQYKAYVLADAGRHAEAVDSLETAFAQGKVLNRTLAREQ